MHCTCKGHIGRNTFKYGYGITPRTEQWTCIDKSEVIQPTIATHLITRKEIFSTKNLFPSDQVGCNCWLDDLWFVNACSLLCSRSYSISILERISPDVALASAVHNWIDILGTMRPCGLNCWFGLEYIVSIFSLLLIRIFGIFWYFFVLLFTISVIAIVQCLV